MHDSKTLSWYSQLPRDATEGSQMALSDIFYSRAQEPSSPPHSHDRPTASNPFVDTPSASGSDYRSTSTVSSFKEFLSGDTSFDIERITDLKDSDSAWVDDEIDEVLLLSRKKHTKKLSVIRESADSSLKYMGTSISSFDLSQVVHDGSGTKCFLATKCGSPKLYHVQVTERRSLGDHRVCRRTIEEQKLLRCVTEAKTPFLPRLYWSFLDAEHLYIVTGHYPVTLLSCLQRNDSFFLQHVLLYMAELIEAICGLHSHGILHRNIGPESVLLGEDGHVILSGLHHATYVSVHDQSDESRWFHMASVAAPESVQEKLSLYHAPELALSWHHDVKVDVWSFGMFMFQLLMHKYPFQEMHHDCSMSKYRSLNDLLQAPLRIDPLDTVDVRAADLAVHCLERNPAFRITPDIVKTHPYFSTIDWVEVRCQKMSVPNIRHDSSPDTVSHLQEGLLSTENSSSLGRSHSPEHAGDIINADQFNFEWREDVAEVNIAGDVYMEKGNCHSRAADTPIPGKPVGSTLGAPSSTLSVTSFGELKRYQRIPVPQSAIPGSNINSVAVDSDHSPIQGRRLQSVSLGEVTPPVRGRLRKYASLDFDLDTIVSLSQDDSDSDSETRSLNKTPVGPKTAPLAYLPRWSPLKNFRFPRGTASASPPAPSASENFLALSDIPPPTSRKLVKKSRMPVISHTQHHQPISGLPTGVEQIGDGIGFTYMSGPSQLPATSDAQKPSTISNPTTPRRSTSLMLTGARSGSLSLLPRILRGRKRGEIPGDSKTVFPVANGAEELEASMRKTYGSSWDLNSTGAAARSAAGLGFGLTTGQSSRILPGGSTFVLPAQEVAAGQIFPSVSGTYGDDLLGDECSGSTLRLVTPVTTPQQRNLWQD